MKLKTRREALVTENCSVHIDKESIGLPCDQKPSSAVNSEGEEIPVEIAAFPCLTYPKDKPIEMESDQDEDSQPHSKKGSESNYHLI